MANTYTSRFNLTKPEVGADTNAWGGHLNADLDTIDSNMVSLLLTSSQTMAGALNLPSNGLNVGSGQLQVTGGNVSASGNVAASGNVSAAGSVSASGNVSGVNASFSGTGSFTGTVTVGAPTASGNATTKTYVDTADALKLNLSGGTMTGILNINSANSVNYLNWYNGASLNAGWGANSSYPLFITNSTGSNCVYADLYGNVTAAGNVTAYSDAKLKENVETIREALSLVKRMRGVFYDRIDSGEHGVGVIAQEMQEVLPQVVVPNDGTLSVAYGNLVGVLIEAVKELSAKVEALETR